MIDRGCFTRGDSLSGGAPPAGLPDQRPAPLPPTDIRPRRAWMKPPQPHAVDLTSHQARVMSVRHFSRHRAGVGTRSAPVYSQAQSISSATERALCPFGTFQVSSTSRRRWRRSARVSRPEQTRDDDAATGPRSPTGEGHRALSRGRGAQPCAPACSRNRRGQRSRATAVRPCMCAEPARNRDDALRVLVGDSIRNDGGHRRRAGAQPCVPTCYVRCRFDGRLTRARRCWRYPGRRRCTG